MCDTCGCGEGSSPEIRKPGEEQMHEHTHEHELDGKIHSHSHSHVHSNDDSHDHPGHDHAHLHTVYEPDHGHDHPLGTGIRLERDILQKNNMLAERNRGYFEAKNILALNLVSSPGSGKTSILERTIRELQKDLSFFIIEGDQQSMQDAFRIEKTGAPVVQVNTGSGCHLDASMVNQASLKLNVADNAVLMIENVGNLVCPAMFDLGESWRVVIISVTEGDDKPLKYPAMFQSSQLCLINKTDLLPYVDFSIDKVKEFALRVNPSLAFIELSAKTGDGFKEWYGWLKVNRNK
jgi:hydrogenase nickel incorporation protein HypB